MISSVSTILFLATAISSTVAVIPSYIHVCKRNDPQLDQCILKSVESLRGKLREGIPELEVPSLEPLKLGDLVVKFGGPMFKFYGTNFVLFGASNYTISEFKTDLKHMNYLVKMSFPKIIITADFEVTGKLLNINLHGKGPVTITAEDIDGASIVKGKKVKRDGQTYLQIDSLDLKLNLKNYQVKLSKGFFKEQSVTDLANTAVHENKKEIIPMIRPRIEQVVKDELLVIANKITKHFTFDELFPEN